MLTKGVSAATQRPKTYNFENLAPDFRVSLFQFLEFPDFLQPNQRSRMPKHCFAVKLGFWAEWPFIRAKNWRIIPTICNLIWMMRATYKSGTLNAGASIQRLCVYILLSQILKWFVLKYDAIFVVQFQINLPPPNYSCV